MNKHASCATYQMTKEPNTNNPKVPNKHQTQQWRPLANVVTAHRFTLFFVVFFWNTSSHLTPHLLLPSFCYSTTTESPLPTAFSHEN